MASLFTVGRHNPKNPEQFELLQIDADGAPGALAVFTSEAAAIAYIPAAESYAGNEWSSEWEVDEGASDILSGFFYRRDGEEEAPVTHVVIDPTPDGGGRVITSFQALAEFE